MRLSSPKASKARTFTAVVRRRAWLATKVFLGLAILVSAVVMQLPATFTSDAVIQLPLAADLPIVTARLNDRSTLEALLPDTYARINPDDEAAIRAAMVDLRARFLVQPLGPDTLRIAFEAPQPAQAREIVARLTQQAIKPVDADKPESAGGGFLDTELADADALLNQQQARLDAYHERHPNENASALEEASRGLLAAQTESQSLAIAIARDRDRLLTLQRQGQTPPPPQPVAKESTPEVRPAPAPDPQLPELAAAKLALTELLVRLTPAHPDVVKQQGVIQELEAAIAGRAVAAAAVTPAASTGPVSPASPSAAPRVASANDEEINQLTQSMNAKELQRRRALQTAGSMRAVIDKAPEAQAELVALMRDYEALQRLRANLHAKSEALASAAVVKARTGRVLQAASLPDSPTRPDRRGLMALGFAGALALALFAGFIQELRDSRVYSEDDLRKLSDVPIMGVVSEVLTSEQAAARRMPVMVRAVLTPAVAAVIVLAWWWAK